MLIFTCVLFAFLLIGSSLLTIVFVWKKEDLKSVAVQMVVVMLTLAGGLYAIIQYPAIFSIGKAINYLSPLK